MDLAHCGLVGRYTYIQSRWLVGGEREYYLDGYRHVGGRAFCHKASHIFVQRNTSATNQSLPAEKPCEYYDLLQFFGPNSGGVIVNTGSSSLV